MCIPLKKILVRDQIGSHDPGHFDNRFIMLFIDSYE